MSCLDVLLNTQVTSPSRFCGIELVSYRNNQMLRVLCALACSAAALSSEQVFSKDNVRTDLHHLQQQQPVELLDGWSSGDAFAADACRCSREATLTRCHREAVQLILAPCIRIRCRVSCHMENKSHDLHLVKCWLPLNRLAACLVCSSKTGRGHPNLYYK